MNLGQIQALALTKLNDAGGIFYADPQGAINEAQRMFALITLSVESTATFALAGATTFYNVLTAIPDFVLSRRMYNSAGQQLRPATIADLEALDSGWQNRPGLPLRYVILGLDFLAVYPQPAGADSLSIVYVQAPATLINQTDVPMIRTASHYALANYAAAVQRQPEGGQELAKFAEYMQDFLDEAQAVAKLVRDRNIDAGYETLPFELQREKR